MLDDHSSKKLELKDWLLLVPVLSTYLAITFEIGSFVPMGIVAFSLFSLSDHLLWALQAFPFALLAVGGILTGYALTALRETKNSQRTTTKPKSRFFTKIVNFTLIVALLSFAVFDRSLSPLLIGTFLLLTMIVPASKVRNSLVGLSVLGMFGTALVFTLGFDLTKQHLNRAVPARFDLGDGGVRALVLVRSGDHGILLYDRIKGEFYFSKIDALKSITWQRPSRAPSISFGR